MIIRQPVVLGYSNIDTTAAMLNKKFSIRNYLKILVQAPKR